jgi:hypothetical protein
MPHFQLYMGKYSHLKVNQQEKKTFHYLVIEVNLMLYYMQPHFVCARTWGLLFNHETGFCCHRLKAVGTKILKCHL